MHGSIRDLLIVAVAVLTQYIYWTNKSQYTNASLCLLFEYKGIIICDRHINVLYDSLDTASACLVMSFPFN